MALPEIEELDALSDKRVDVTEIAVLAPISIEDSSR